MVSTPSQPDPMATAQAQGAMNRDTANYQQSLNMMDQITPYGNVTYTQTGQKTFKDSAGRTQYVPSYTATQTLTPEQQRIKEQSDAASYNLSKLANTQSSFLNDYMAKPFSYNRSDLEDYVYNLGTQRLDPRFAKEEQSARAQLINSGIRPGTPAYQAAMDQLGQNRNDAYNQLALGANDQAFNQALTVRNQPINEIGALMGGSQVQQPNYVQTPQSQVAGVDYTGLVNNKYQADSQRSSAMMGGLFGLAAAPFQAMKLSDRRLKKDVKKIGEYSNGINKYTFRYMWQTPETPLSTGAMADEVSAVLPHAVHTHPSGYSMVNYGELPPC